MTIQLNRWLAAMLILLSGHVRADDGLVRAAMDTMLKASYPLTRPGASVIVVRNGRVLFRGSYGVANVELGVASDASMVYGIGSMTKQFTAAGILLLVNEGKIKLDADIRTYLSDVRDNGPAVTVEQLLNHTSGIKNYFELPAWRAAFRDETTPRALLQVIDEHPRDFYPGTAGHYSNSNYTLLGAVIERVSGLSYGDFMRSRLFEPLGMKDTSYPSTGQVVPLHVTGYNYRGGKLIDAPYINPTQLYAAAGMVSSVDDLARWNAALDAGTLIPRKLILRAWTPGRLDDGTSTGYGYGWANWTWQGHKVVGHDGNIYGFLSAMARFPDDHLFVVVLENSTHSGTSADDVCMRLAAIALGIQPKPSSEISMAPSVLDRYTGTYYGGASEVWHIRHKDGELEFRRNNDEWDTSFATNPTTFLLRESRDTIRLEGLRDGVPSRLTHEGNFTGIEHAYRLDAVK